MNASASLNRFVLSVILLAASLMSSTPVRAGAYEDYFDAVKRDDPARLSALLKRGMDPNTIEEARGDTAMMLALREGATKVFNLLLNQPGVDLEARAKNGDTALMIAAFKGNKTAVSGLIEKGAEVNRPGWTPLHYAAAGGHSEVVSLLLEHHAYIDAESPNKTTPLMMAAWGGNILTVKLLLDEGADPGARNANGMDVVDFARYANKPDIVEGLLHRLGRSERKN